MNTKVITTIIFKIQNILENNFRNQVSMRKWTYNVQEGREIIWSLRLSHRNQFEYFETL